MINFQENSTKNLTIKKIEKRLKIEKTMYILKMLKKNLKEIKMF